MTGRIACVVAVLAVLGARNAFAIGQNRLPSTAGNGSVLLQSDSRIVCTQASAANAGKLCASDSDCGGTSGGCSEAVDAEATFTLPPSWTDRFNNKFTATGTSAGVLGATKTCAYVLLCADVDNGGPVHWNYGTATTNSPPVPPGTCRTVYSPVNLNGNGIEGIQGSGCSSDCLLWATCQ